MFMGRGRMELMLASLGAHGVEEVKDQSLKATQRARITLRQYLRQLNNRVPLWIHILLITLITLLVLILTNTPLPRIF